MELWRRLLFNILISNTDDHLRNHGFLYERYKGWRLSPVYDLNPVPLEIKLRMHSLAISLEDHTGSFSLALEVSSYFGLALSEAKAIARKIAKVVSTWRKVAARLNLSKAEIERMASAFEHSDLQECLSNEIG